MLLDIYFDKRLDLVENLSILYSDILEFVNHATLNNKGEIENQFELA